MKVRFVDIYSRIQCGNFELGISSACWSISHINIIMYIYKFLKEFLEHSADQIEELQNELKNKDQVCPRKKLVAVFFR